MRASGSRLRSIDAATYLRLPACLPACLPAPATGPRVDASTCDPRWAADRMIRGYFAKDEMTLYMKSQNA